MKSIIKYLRKHSKETVVTKENSLSYKTRLGTVGIILFFVIWAVGGYFLFKEPGHELFAGLLPAPTLKALLLLITDPDFWHSVYASLRRVVVGVSIAFIIGFPSGLIIGFYDKIRTISYPPIQLIRMTSPLSWMPIALLIFTSFESAIYFLITMATIWPIILNTSLGVSHVNPQWIKMAQCQGATNRQLIFQIVIPASVPHILTSLRLALGVAWIVLVPAEFLGVSSGLGYIINDARDTMEYDRLMAIVLSIGIIGFVLDGFLQQIKNVFQWSWH